MREVTGQEEGNARLGPRRATFCRSAGRRRGTAITNLLPKRLAPAGEQSDQVATLLARERVVRAVVRRLMRSARAEAQISSEFGSASQWRSRQETTGLYWALPTMVRGARIRSLRRTLPLNGARGRCARPGTPNGGRAEGRMGVCAPHRLR